MYLPYGVKFLRAFNKLLLYGNDVIVSTVLGSKMPQRSDPKLRSNLPVSWWDRVWDPLWRVYYYTPKRVPPLWGLGYQRTLRARARAPSL